jgi:hypothetical protein
MLADPQLTEKVYANPLIKGLSQNVSGKTHKPSYIPANIFAQAVMALDVIQTFKADPKANEGLIPEALAFLISKAGGDPHKELVSIEQWYNDTMDRVSGWYKRNVQIIIFILGLVIVVGLNVDTIAIITNISNDTAIRAGLVSAVQGYAASPSNSNLPAIQKAFEQIQPIIGWSSSTLPTDWTGWILKIVGLLATTLAISLGAPFWFDLLNKFMLFRSSGPPPKPSPTPAQPPSPAPERTMPESTESIATVL